MRTNIYKDKILTILKKKHLLSIAEINKIIPEADHSTVFRNIEQLVGERQIKKILINNRSIAYELSSENHNHFICDSCGMVELINISAKNSVLKNKIISDITVRGSCGGCNKRKK